MVHHPMTIMAVVQEVERERQRERQKLQVRSQAVAASQHGSNCAPAASGAARRLIAGFGLRPRLS